MGRGYKTTASSAVDYMYELPKELMMGAIQNVSSEIAKTEEDTIALNDQLKLQYLSADSGEAKAKLSGYKSQIEEFAKQIQADPMKYRKQTSAIRNLGRTIKEDFETGDAYKIQTAYNTRQANKKALEELWTKNPDKYNYEDIEGLMKINDAKYEGFKAGDYQQNMLKEYINIDDYEELAKGYEAEIIKKHGAFKNPKDGKLYTRVDFIERVNPELIKQDLQNAIMEDEKLWGYYSQQIQLGNTDEKSVLNKVANTIERLGNKYGYNKIEKGLTSIKNDDEDTAAFVESLKNPMGNLSPGTIYNEPLVSDYLEKDAAGNVINTSSSAVQVTEAINAVKAQQKETLLGLITTVQKANIILTPEIQNRVLAGDFSALKDLKNANGDKLQPDIILAEQTKYNKLVEDRKIFEKKQAKAIASGDAEKYLKENPGGGNLQTIGGFQELGLIKKGMEKDFKTAVQNWKTGFKNSPQVNYAPLKLDPTQLATLTTLVSINNPSYDSSKPVSTINQPQIEMPLNKVLQDGKSIEYYTSIGLLKNKNIKIGEKPGTKTVVDKYGKWYNPFDSDTYKEVPDTRNVTGVYAQTNEPLNYKVVSDNLTPTFNFDGEGNSIAQFSLEINGHKITTYMNEKVFSNTKISETLDLDRMSAAHKINTADAEGVIDETPFEIDGVNFTRTSVGIMANGTYNQARAIEAMARKMEEQRLKLFKK